MSEKIPYPALEKRIRELEKVEADLRLKNDIVAFCSSAIATWDLEGKMTYGNPAFMQKWGFNHSAEFVGLPFWDFWLVADRLDEITAALLTVGSWSDEIQARKRNGAVFDVHVSASTIYDDDGRPAALMSASIDISEIYKDGKPHSIMGTAGDITERKRTEEALRKSEEQYRFLVETADDIIWTFDLTSMTYTYCSKSVEHILGYQAEEALGYGLDVIFEAETQKRVVDAFSKVVTGETKSERILLEAEHRHRNGSPVWLEINAVLHRDSENTPVAFTGVSRDITGRKHAEKFMRQAYKMKAIDTLAGGIAHEFNNMLGIILGNAELAVDDIDPTHPVKEYLDEIENASLRAKEVVRKLMRVARKGPTMRKPLRISQIVQETVSLLRRMIPASISIRSSIRCQSETILADSTEMHQIIINLCNNAVHAVGQNAGVIEIDLTAVTLDGPELARYEGLRGGDYVKLALQDTGDGIAPEIMDRVFDPYFTTKDVHEGLGMGLAVVHGIVKQHDGAIHIESVPGNGTRVEVLFPQIAAEHESEMTQAVPRQTGSERILLVDDEPSVLKTARRIIERYGYYVVAKLSSLESLAMFTAAPDQFDLVITDMAMPDMPGDALAREIIRIRPDIPVMLCTGHSDYMDAETARRSGIRAFVMKPFNRQDLAATIRDVLDRGQADANDK